MTEVSDDIILSISADAASLRRTQKRIETAMKAMADGVDKNMNDASKTADKHLKEIEKRAREMQSKLEVTFSKPIGSGVSKGLAAVGSVLGANELRKMTDEWTDLTSRVNLAAGSIEGGTQVMGRLGDMARRTYSDLSQTTESYLLSSTALRELGYSTNQSLDYTEALNNALVVSGAKGERAARVIDALGKSMATGKLSGDNLNTVIESGGRVAEALAAGLGTTTNGLRALGAQGKITGDAIVKALTSQMQILRKEAADMPATIGDGFTLLNNALLQYVGNADQATGISAKMAEALILIADNFDQVADAGLQVAAVFAGVLVGRSLANMTRALGTTTASVVKFTQALKAAKGAGEMVSAFGGLGVAAGPLGAIIGGALVLAVGKYAAGAIEASRNSDELRAEMEKLGLLAPKVADGLDQAAESLDKLTAADRARKLKQINDEIDRLRNGGGAFSNWVGNGDELNSIANRAMVAFASKEDGAARQQIAQMARDFGDFKITAEDVRAKLVEINGTNVSEGVVQLGKDLEETVAVIAASEAYTTQFGDTLEQNVAKTGSAIQDLKTNVENFNRAEPIGQKHIDELNKLIDEFTNTGRGAEQLKSKLQDIENAHPNFKIIKNGFFNLIDVMNVVIKTAQDAGRAMSMAYPKGQDSDKKERATADPYIVQRRAENAAAEEYERNALKRAQLSKEQFVLENKIAEVRKRSETDNQKLTDAQVKRIAEAELAGDRSRLGEGKKPAKEKTHQKTADQKLDSDVQALKDRTEALKAETAMVGLSYQEQEKRRASLDLEQAALAKLRDEAIKKGQTDLSSIKLSPEQKAAIDEVSEAYARQAEALRRVQESQERADQAAMDFYQSFKSGMIGAITGADSLSDALSGLLRKLAELALNSAFDSLFKPSSGGSSGGMLGGAFSWIGGLLGRKDGGPIQALANGGRVRGPGGPRDDKVLMWGSNGEFMMNAAATQKWLPILEAMNADRLPKRANGGPVGFSMPTMPQMNVPLPNVPSISDMGGAVACHLLRCIILMRVGLTLRRFPVWKPDLQRPIAKCVRLLLRLCVRLKVKT